MQVNRNMLCSASSNVVLAGDVVSSAAAGERRSVECRVSSKYRGFQYHENVREAFICTRGLCLAEAQLISPHASSSSLPAQAKQQLYAVAL